MIRIFFQNFSMKRIMKWLYIKNKIIKRTINKIIIITVPAKMPGCAKKLAARSSLLSILTPLPLESVSPEFDLPPLGCSPLLIDWFGSDSISESSSLSPSLLESTPIIPFSAVKFEYTRKNKVKISSNTFLKNDFFFFL